MINERAIQARSPSGPQKKTVKVWWEGRGERESRGKLDSSLGGKPLALGEIKTITPC